MMENAKKDKLMLRSNYLKCSAGFVVCLLAFLAFTVATKLLDVQPIGPLGTDVGFASVNGPLYAIFGQNDTMFAISEALGRLALATAGAFGGLGLMQWIQRKNMLKVDADILALGVFYILVIGLYVFFNRYAVNYRPIIEAGKDFPEPSYPSSHTVLMCCVMITGMFQCRKRLKGIWRTLTTILMPTLAAAMIVTRLLAGVHWPTDIFAGTLLSESLIALYMAAYYKLEMKKA